MGVGKIKTRNLLFKKKLNPKQENLIKTNKKTKPKQKYTKKTKKWYTKKLGNKKHQQKKTHT